MKGPNPKCPCCGLPLYQLERWNNGGEKFWVMACICGWEEE